MVSKCVLAMMFLFSSGSTGSKPLAERVDLIELNHCYDDLGRHTFDQIIFYQWSPDYRRFHVIAWCLVENDLSRMPTKVPGGEDYVVNWYDRDARVQRQVRSNTYRETWTQSDPERLNRKFLNEKYRTSLMRHPNRPVIR
jgi:hypothetical protein